MLIAELATKVNTKQAIHFAAALACGEKQAGKSIAAIVEDKVRDRIARTA